MNYWKMDLGIAKVVNTHHLAKLHSVVKKKSNMLTWSIHKEETPSGKKTHEKITVRVVSQMDRYTKPFNEKPARNVKPREIIDDKVYGWRVKRLVKIISNFYRRKIDSLRRKSEIFAPIRNPKIINWLKEEERDPKCNKYIKRG